jgi:peptidylprolyl isomerase
MTSHRNHKPFLFSAALFLAGIGLVACSDSGTSSDTSELASSPDTSQPAEAVAEPKVVLPKEGPTKLVITDITKGTGDGAVAGDTLAVFYVGVLSADGTKFDGNFGGSPFNFTLGAGGVIKGWDEGLVGLKVGGRRQLDIPSDLAYAEKGAGDIIKPNSALSFIIDLRSIIPASKPEDAPKVTIKGAPARLDLKSEDLKKGSGATVKEGQDLALHIVAFRGDTGVELLNSWTNLAPITLSLKKEESMPGLFEGLVGMKVGGRRQLTIPFKSAFGEAGNTDMQLPAKTDLVLVVDVLAIM